VQEALWTKLGKKTAMTMADGAAVLASIWLGAWKQGKGSKIPKDQRGRIDPMPLKKHYENRKFVELLNLDEIGAVLK
jgi:hypothetical protein